MDRDEKGVFLKGHKNFRIKREGNCRALNCDNAILAGGYCGKHYQRYKKYGNANEPSHWQGRPKSGKDYTCGICNKVFYRRISEIQKGSTHYCSRHCAFIGQKGKPKKIKPIEQSNWRINRKGYLETTRQRKRILQHRLIVENHIKRPLIKGEIIHHLNGIKTDNRLENLALCSDHTHHLFIKKLKDRILELELLLNLKEAKQKEEESHLCKNILHI